MMIVSGSKRAVISRRWIYPGMDVANGRVLFVCSKKVVAVRFRPKALWIKCSSHSKTIMSYSTSDKT